MSDKPNTTERANPENISYAKLATEVLVPVAVGGAVGGIAGAAIAGAACAGKESASVLYNETGAKKVVDGVVDFLKHEKDLWKSILCGNSDK